MKSSNLAYRWAWEQEPPDSMAPPLADPAEAATLQVEARAAARRQRARASFGYRAILIRDQGFRPFRVR